MKILVLITPQPDEVEIIADSEHHRKAILKYARLNPPFTLTIANLANVPERKLVLKGGE